MKVLYAIQGTGNGHISRAVDIIPALQKYCEIDVLVSGYQLDIKIPFRVKYRYRGLSFIFGKSGGIDLWNTYVEANTRQLRKETQECPVEEYDFVINDFEPVSAWSCYQKQIPCVALSHQAALLDKNAPNPKKQDLLGRFILKNFAPSNLQFGIHFGQYSPSTFTPVIRTEIRNIKVQDKGHYTVYLPSYNDEKILKILNELGSVKWQVFSKHTKNYSKNSNIEVYPINNTAFIKSMSQSRGILCGARFETPSEAMFLGKKLFVIPMKGQYEQQCNAAALKEIGVPVMKKLNLKNLYRLQNWIDSEYKIEINYPNVTGKMVSQIFESQVLEILRKNHWESKYELKYPQASEIEANILTASAINKQRAINS